MCLKRATEGGLGAVRAVGTILEAFMVEVAPRLKLKTGHREM